MAFAIPAIPAILEGIAAAGSAIAGFFTVETAATVLVVAGTITLTGDTPVKDRKVSEEAQKRLDAIIAAGLLTAASAKCKKCPASTGSAINESRFSNDDDNINKLYQIYICERPYGPGWIEEWMFATVSFDGFVAASCLLQEAKGNYDQFFDGKIPFEWWGGRKGMLMQAMVQYAVVMLTPPDKLMWYFMQPISYAYFHSLFIQYMPTFAAVYQPF